MFSFFNKTMSDNSKTFFDFKINSINGEELDLSIFENKTILLVNVASNCGFTKQYDGLQNLYDDYKDKGLVVIGVPSNQFGGQEPGTESEIKIFVRPISIFLFQSLVSMMLKEIMHIQYTYGQRIHMENLQFQNGIFIKF